MLNIPLQESFIITIGLNLVLLLLGMQLFRLYRFLSSTSVHLNDSGIFYKDYKGEKSLLFEEIKQIKFPCHGNGIWVKIIAEKTTISILHKLDDMDLFLSDFKHALDVRGLKNRYDHGKMFNMIRKMIFLKLFGGIFSNMKIMHLVLTLFPFLTIGMIFGVIAGIGFKFIGVWLLISLVYFLLVFAFYISFLLRYYFKRLKKESDEESFTFPSGNPEFERQLGMKTLFRAGILYVVLTMAFFLNAPFWTTMIQ